MLVLLAASVLSLLPLVPLPMKGLLSRASKSAAVDSSIWLRDLLRALSLSADKRGLIMEGSSYLGSPLYTPPAECCELSMLEDKDEADALVVWMKSNREPLPQNSVTREIAGGMIATP